MAARISDSSLIEEHQQTFSAPPRHTLEQEAGTIPHNGSESSFVPVRPSILPSSPSTSLPTVSEMTFMPSALPSQTLPPQTFPPPCDRPSRRLERKYTLADLMAKARRMCGRGTEIQERLAEADRYINKGKNAFAIPLLENALMLVGEEPQLQCLLWRLLGNAHLSLGHFKKASVCHMHQLAFCRELSDFEGMTRAECNLGIAYMKLGLLKLAGRCFVQYLDNSKIIQDEMGIAYACSNLGVLAKQVAVQEYLRSENNPRISAEEKRELIERFKDHVKKAISYFEQHLEIVERKSDLEKQSRAYGNISSCYEMLQQHVKAIFGHSKRLDIVRSISNRYAEACTLCNLGNCQRAIGKLEEAIDSYTLGLEICQTTNNRTVEMVILLNLGTTCELLGQIDRAIEWHTLYLSMNVQANDLPGQARALGILADLYWKTNQMVKAHAYYRKLVEVFQQLGNRDAQAIALQHVVKSKEVVERQKRVMKMHRRAVSKKGSKQDPRQAKKYQRYRAANSHLGSGQGSLRSLLNTNSTTGMETVYQRRTRSVDRHTKRRIGPPGIKRWYNVKSMGPDVATRSLESPLVLENRHAFQDALHLGNQTNFYQSAAVAEDMEQEGDLGDVLREDHTSFYTLGAFMGPTFVHANSPTDDDSVVEYEEIEMASHFRTRSEIPLFYSSARHSQDLKQIGHSLLSMAASDPGGQGAEEEWVRWLRVHAVGPKARVAVPPTPPLTTKQKSHGHTVLREAPKQLTRPPLTRNVRQQGKVYANPAKQRESALI